MITATHCVIRTSEQDDAIALKRLYDPSRPRAALLDRKRELLIPTVDELRELLSQKEAKLGVFHSIEDRCGVLRGFCSLRATHPEVSYAELVVMLFEDADYTGPLGEEILDFLTHRAFGQMKLNKVIAQCLDSERAYRGFLTGHGFESEGVQRDAFFTHGRWRSIESLTLFRAAWHDGRMGDGHAD